MIVNSLVSIVTPHYNNLRNLKQTLESVAQQTYLNYEHIIIDDCSSLVESDALKSLITGFPKTLFITLESNSGAAIARNEGIKHASGRYIAFLDADDVWAPTKLSRQVTFMQEHNLDLCYSAYKVIDQHGAVTSQRSAPSTVTYESLLKCNEIGCLTAIYDTERLGKVFMPELRKRQDLAFWLKLMKLGAKSGGMPESLAYYRVGDNSLSSNKCKVLPYQWAVYRECEQLNIFQSAYYFAFYAWNGVSRHYW
ncbi:glycosyltransferase family 2 protein [Vibrio sp. TBV020]|uniref:glycosyltransferase family 2 protein n=1 Tax=Vibrio sp. TBV020 TaxID=3137398 RepID=UPI0038CD738A